MLDHIHLFVKFKYKLQKQKKNTNKKKVKDVVPTATAWSVTALLQRDIKVSTLTFTSFIYPKHF